MEHLQALREKYVVREEFAERIGEASKSLFDRLSDGGRHELGRLLDEVFKLEAVNLRTAQHRVRALASLREALKAHLKMLETLKGRLDKVRAGSLRAPNRRFSIDDLPPN